MPVERPCFGGTQHVFAQPALFQPRTRVSALIPLLLHPRGGNYDHFTEEETGGQEGQKFAPRRGGVPTGCMLLAPVASQLVEGLLGARRKEATGDNDRAPAPSRQAPAERPSLPVAARLQFLLSGLPVSSLLSNSLFPQTLDIPARCKSDGNILCLKSFGVFLAPRSSFQTAVGAPLSRKLA